MPAFQELDSTTLQRAVETAIGEMVQRFFSRSIDEARAE
jgi:hypothetical protein